MLFSKPVSALELNLEWHNLPPNGFTNHYQLYNKFLAGDLTVKHISETSLEESGKPPAQADKPNSSLLSGLLSGKKSWVSVVLAVLKLVGEIIGLIASEEAAKHKKPTATGADDSAGPFNNEAFTVDFSVLSDKGWQPVDFALQNGADKPADQLPLFATSNKKLLSQSQYASAESTGHSPLAEPVPALQN